MKSPNFCVMLIDKMFTYISKLHFYFNRKP